MKRIFLAFLLLRLSVSQATAVSSKKVVYQRSDSLRIVSLLREARSMPATTCWPVHFAMKFEGVKYRLHTLEVSDPERLIVNVSRLDCTTLVETVTALTLCVRQGRYAWDDYLQMLTSLRYRNGELNGFTSRLHYFSDWIADNQRRGNVVEIQSPNPPFTATQTLKLNYMSRHPKAYRQLKAHKKMIPDIAKAEQQLSGTTIRYIPKSLVGGSREKLSCINDGDILCMTTQVKGLDITHLGFAVWKKDGLHLINASQIHHGVVLEPMTLYKYQMKHPHQTGIRVVRISK